ncbi:MAG: type-F conjugative transfer system secretin TraK [Succinivibrio dextrinosolvens]|nr:type-F conjugative transfer system secretin TraK [Succinivibrio dextrinosolvens]MDY6465200.1 type-F conjugative transfer system secretin TraK [Succinivibrio dextrinosolvens]MDY6470623.1 type-F conjugative transfer system secretin TraK [Succinivibrio dextrinosolvens]
MKQFRISTIAYSCALAMILTMPTIAAQNGNTDNPLIAIPNLNNASSSTAAAAQGTPLNASAATPLIDPALIRIKQEQDNAKLKEQIEKLKTENQHLKESIGVEQTKIPEVPATVLTNNVPKYNVNGTGAASASGKEANDIVVSPGVNQLVSIAVGHTNRIVTPFTHPQVSSATLTGGEQGEVMVKDNVVYVSTAKTYPLSMFITEKGQENLSISLTLVPRKIPSREISVTFKDSNVQMRLASEDAEAWEKSQPFVSGTNKNLREVALQGIPSGYNLSSIPSNYKLPKCRVEGFKVDFSNGQLITGSKLHYVIGKVTNVSSQTLEFKEAGCGDYDVAAVALYPTNVFEPHQSAEIYVIKHAVGRQEVKQVRTSVLDK